MTKDQQPILNGAYYGPSIPPPPKTYHRPSRSPSCCCCDCLFDCGCCLLSCVFKIIFTIIVIIGLIVLVFWLIVRPHEVKFHATDASLTQFNLSTTTNSTTANNLAYNLALNLTIRNPNKHVGIYYDSIDVTAYYDDQRFGFKSLSPFYQGHKNTTDVGPVTLTGNNVVVLSSGQSSDFENQKSDGVFDISVKLRMNVRFKLGWAKIGKFKPKVDCDLQVPLSSSGKSFQSTKCKYDL